MSAQFRKKPVTISAVQFTGGNHQEISAFMGCECGFGNPVRDDCPYDHSKAGPRFVFIRTLEGAHRADRGDWIIRGVKGEFYPCKPEIFEQTYEPATNEHGHKVEIEFNGLYPSVKLIHPDTGCPEGEEGEACWLTDWLENEGVELLRGKLTLPVKWDLAEYADHPVFHAIASQPDLLQAIEGEVEWAEGNGLGLAAGRLQAILDQHRAGTTDA